MTEGHTPLWFVFTVGIICTSSVLQLLPAHAQSSTLQLPSAHGQSITLLYPCKECWAEIVWIKQLFTTACARNIEWVCLADAEAQAEVSHLQHIPFIHTCMRRTAEAEAVAEAEAGSFTHRHIAAVAGAGAGAG